MTDTIPTPIEAGNIELEESKDQQHEKKRTVGEKIEYSSG